MQRWLVIIYQNDWKVYTEKKSDLITATFAVDNIFFWFQI